jgi:hypothetical protein
MADDGGDVFFEIFEGLLAGQRLAFGVFEEPVARYMVPDEHVAIHGELVFLGKSKDPVAIFERIFPFLVHPESGHEVILGSDSAELPGDEGREFFVIQIADGEAMAQPRSILGPAASRRVSSVARRGGERMRRPTTIVG